MRSRNLKNRLKKCVILEILRSDFEKSLIRMIAVHRPTCWNWNIGYLKKCLKSRIIDFGKLSSFLKSAFRTLITRSTYHFFERIARIDAESKYQKSMRKSVILKILRSDFDKSLISVIAVQRPTCWNWNIGYLKNCLKSRIIDF